MEFKYVRIILKNTDGSVIHRFNLARCKNNIATHKKCSINENGGMNGLNGDWVNGVKP